MCLAVTARRAPGMSAKSMNAQRKPPKEGRWLILTPSTAGAGARVHHRRLRLSTAAALRTKSSSPESVRRHVLFCRTFAEHLEHLADLPLRDVRREVASPQMPSLSALAPLTRAPAPAPVAAPAASAPVAPSLPVAAALHWLLQLHRRCILARMCLVGRHGGSADEAPGCVLRQGIRQTSPVLRAFSSHTHVEHAGAGRGA